jgi:hypothetical protein
MSAGAVPSNEYLIQSVVLAANQAVVVFDVSGLGNHFRHLRLECVTKSNRAAETEALGLTFNNDSGANYAFHGLGTFAGSLTSSGASSRNTIEFGSCGASDSNRFFPSSIDILDAFSTNKNKVVRCLQGIPLPTFPNAGLASGVWFNTAAITSIRLQQVIGTEFLQHSRFSLYGVTA